MEEELAISLLGGVRAQRAGTPLSLGGRRARACLAVLALSAGRTLSADALTSRVWDEHELPDRPRAAVQTVVSRLRSALGKHVVLTEPNGYRLDLPRQCVDVHALSDAFARAAEATTPEDERDLLTEALTQWQAAPLGEELSEWLSRHERPRLEEVHLRAVERRIDLDLEAGEPAHCAVELRQLIEEQPLRETLWVRLLRVLVADGHRAEALEAYEQIRVRLAHELGVDPSPALQDFHQRLLRGEVPDATTGGRRMRQIPRQLPADVSAFTGRALELQQLDDLLLGDEPGSRLVVVHGAGGSGKTSLALHWANRVTAQFPDGQLFLNLRGFGQGPVVPVDLALELLLRSTGAHGRDIPGSVEERSALLRSAMADRRALIVLDNVQDPEQVRPLLPGAPTAVLVTSRSQLRGLAAIDGAVPLPVGPMSPGEAVDLVRARLRGAAEPDGLLAQLAELCGHLPIALVVAAERAAREGEAAVHALIERLRDDRVRLGELSRGTDPLTDVRGVFASTYDSLEGEEGAMFRLLALHPLAPISTGAATALWGVAPSVAEHVLDGLVDRHLVRLLRPGWFDLHDLARDYAAERLREVDDQVQETAARRRLHSWYVHSADAACLALGRYSSLIDCGPLDPGTRPQSFPGPRHAQAWLAGHRRALTQTVDQAVEQGGHALVCRLVPRVAYYLGLLSARSEELALNRIALDSARRLDSEHEIAGALNNLGVAHGRHQRTDEAMVCFLEALPYYEKAGHWLGASRVRGNIALLHDICGRHDQAADEFIQLLAELAALGADPAEALSVLNNLANAHLHAGRPREALRRARECRDTARHLGATSSEALGMDGAGSAHLALGDADAASQSFLEAAEVYRRLGDLAGEVRVLVQAAQADRAAGHKDRAHWALTRCRRLIDEVESGGGSVRERQTVEQLLADT